MPDSSDRQQESYPGHDEASSCLRRNSRFCIIMIIILLIVLVLLGLAAQYWSRESQGPEREELGSELPGIERHVPDGAGLVCGLALR